MRPLHLLLLSWLLVSPALLEAQELERSDLEVAEGITLATDVWRPSGEHAPRPVILRRTPYGRAWDAGVIGALLDSGYVAVSQDVRGRGESTGRFVAFFDDEGDGAATMAWIAEQPWSDGRIVTYGASAEGIVQLMAAGAGPEALRGAFILVATDDLYESLLPGGLWRDELTTAWLTGLGHPDVLDEWRDEERETEYWSPVRMDATRRGEVRAPTYQVGGFYDVFAAETLRAHRRLRAEGHPDAREDHYLIMGPWTHGIAGRNQGELRLPADADYDGRLFPELLVWLDFCLHGGDRPSWAPLRYYVAQIGDDGRSVSGDWRDAEAWPPHEGGGADYFLSAEGTLSRDAPAEASDSLAVDPSAPVPSVGGANLSTPAGPRDQRAVDARDDVFIADTEPFAQAVELIGDPRARIRAASSGTDADVIVRLSQVTPSGRVLMLTDGGLRGRFREGRDTIRPMAPGESVDFEIALGPVAHVIPAGHSLRVSISGTSAPRFEPNTGQASPLADGASPEAHELTLSFGPSYVHLPIVGAPSAPRDGGSPPDAGSEPEAPPAGCGCHAPSTKPPPPLGLFALALLLRRYGRGRRRQRRTHAILDHPCPSPGGRSRSTRSR